MVQFQYLVHTFFYAKIIRDNNKQIQLSHWFVLFFVSSLVLNFIERGGRSRRWQRGWAKNRFENTRAISRFCTQLQKQSPSRIPGSVSGGHRCLCVHVCANVKLLLVSGKPKELNGFFFLFKVKLSPLVASLTFVVPPGTFSLFPFPDLDPANLVFSFPRLFFISECLFR